MTSPKPNRLHLAASTAGCRRSPHIYANTNNSGATAISAFVRNIDGSTTAASTCRDIMATATTTAGLEMRIMGERVPTLSTHRDYRFIEPAQIILRRNY